MKIAWLEIENFRVLKSVRLELEESLSLLVGRNNSGKTSVLLAIEKLTQSSSPKVTVSDLNLDFLKELNDAIAGDKLDEFAGKGIVLRVRIDYGEDDNIACLRPALMDLDDQNNTVIVEWRYEVDESKASQFMTEYGEWLDAHASANKTPAMLHRFLKRRMRLLFSLKRLALETRDGEVVDRGHSAELQFVEMSRIFQYGAIRVPRGVSNVDSSSALSGAAERYYASLDDDSDEGKSAKQIIDSAFDQADDLLTSQYKKVFADVVKDVGRFGGIRSGESVISLLSNLNASEALKGNIQVGYIGPAGDEAMPTLPEWANGLGYMNLISILMEMVVALKRLKSSDDVGRAAVNLLVVEEPEAHTHPQLQRIFMTQIKRLLKERWPEGEKDGAKDGFTSAGSSLQAIVTTHSAHIVASATFDDIKYFRRSDGGVEIRNLSNLEALYDKKAGEEARYKFLTHYLTVSRADILFADELILFEGDTERILLPAMMKKFDMSREAKGTEGDEGSTAPSGGQDEAEAYVGLTSRHISLVEAGAYSEVFDPLIRFLGLRTLIITDADYRGADNQSTCYMPGCKSGNAAVKHFLRHVQDFEKDQGAYLSENCLTKLVYDSGENGGKGGWRLPGDDEVATLCVATQGVFSKDDVKYVPYSFEDAFFVENRKFVMDNKEQFTGLKNRKLISDTQCPYHFAESCIGSKPSFAMDILLNSSYDNGEVFGGWVTPQYIQKGLTWLAEG